MSMTITIPVEVRYAELCAMTVPLAKKLKAWGITEQERKAINDELDSLYEQMEPLEMKHGFNLDDFIEFGETVIEGWKATKVSA